MNQIRKSIATVLATGALMLGATAVFAADNIVENAREGCKSEINTFCKDVTPGEGRVLSCLAAHEDKLSGRCGYSLYEASAQLERFTAAIHHVAIECKAELEKNCGHITEVGQGQLAQCLKKNEATASATCKQAMKDTQMEVK